MTLWHLLISICFVLPITCALGSAERAKVGYSGYALALSIGLALAVLSTWAMWTVGKTVASRRKMQSVSLGERYARMLYLAAILWIMFVGFLGLWLPSALFRLAF
jgi:ABC-type nickel/cobalt efflux system permease component RcnA